MIGALLRLAVVLSQAESEWGMLKDIRGPRQAPFRVPWIALLFLLAAVLAFWAWRRFGPKRTRIEPPKPAHLLAEIELDRLMREGLLDRGEMELFVTRLSDILRRYIENRFQLRAPERTTEEFYEDLRGSSALAPIQQQAVMEFLRQADMVKFAAEWIERDRALTLLDRVRAFVRETRVEATNVRAGAKAA